MATDIPFQNGYIKDEWSQLVEPAFRSVEGRAFLWTGRAPEVGQRTETQITASDGAAGWCRLSGVVTEVGPLPTLDEWRDGNSCQLPPEVRDDSSPVERQLELREDFAERFGTLHGQTVTSYAFLNLDFYDRQEGLPFKRARVYKVTHRADENMSFFWCVAKIEDVLKGEEPPEAFRKWQEGSGVSTAGRGSATRVSF
mmetsp:Transcript_24633/g.52515  ORF Transcript_24633/g.52515 Transcript_24633/m.52515 type:complete len:198 (-) Transcript_24633:240-833(-)